MATLILRTSPIFKSFRTSSLLVSRFNSTSVNVPPAIDQTNQARSGNTETATQTTPIEESSATSITDQANQLASNGNIRWEFDGTQLQDYKIDLLSQLPVTNGAIIPFSDFNFGQTLFAPYQYAIMHYVDLLATHWSTPWWLSIIGATATMKILFFPLVVTQNKIGIRVNNVMPQTQQLQVKINEALMNGDAYNSAIARTKLKLLYKEENIEISKRIIPPLIQAPAFLCLFFTFRNLATYYKLPAMTTGGILWFTDLTICDPLYILPAITSVSMFLLLEYGLEGGNRAALLGPTGRWFLRALPFTLFFVFQNFPSAVLLFWITNNLMTLSFSLILRAKPVKKFFNIPESIIHDPSSLPLTNQSFSSQVAKAKEKARGHRTVYDLRKFDDNAFQKAGIGPLRKTYKDNVFNQEK